jgi:hypothetical protein
MQVITSWTGARAYALQQALRMTNESFARYLDVSPRSVAGWHKKLNTVIAQRNQGCLDTALERASDRAKAHFAQLLAEQSGDNAGTRHAEALEIPRESPLRASPGEGAEFGDSDYLVSVRSHIQEIVALDNRFGAADLVRLSTRFFRTLHDQLGTGAYASEIERDLHSAAGELAEVVGWLAYDAEAHDLARRMNQESLYYTRLSGDKTMELLTLQNSSMHAASQGRPMEALRIARSVLEGDYRLSNRVKALFLTRKARALAQGGDESALGMFPEIRSLFLDGVNEWDPAWAWWIDEHELDWHEAMAQRDLGLVGEAIGNFERSVIATPATETRGQYIHRAYLLQAQVDNSTWHDAEQTIRQLLPLSAEVASTRTVILLRKALGQLAKRDDKVPSSLQEQAAMLSATLDEAPT